MEKQFSVEETVRMAEYLQRLPYESKEEAESALEGLLRHSPDVFKVSRVRVSDIGTPVHGPGHESWNLNFKYEIIDEDVLGKRIEINENPMCDAPELPEGVHMVDLDCVEYPKDEFDSTSVKEFIEKLYTTVNPGIDFESYMNMEIQKFMASQCLYEVAEHHEFTLMAAERFALRRCYEIVQRYWSVFPIKIKGSDGKYQYLIDRDPGFNSVAYAKAAIVINKDEYAKTAYGELWDDKKYLWETEDIIGEYLRKYSAYDSGETWQVHLYEDGELVDFSPVYYGKFEDVYPEILADIPAGYRDMLENKQYELN